MRKAPRNAGMRTENCKLSRKAAQLYQDDLLPGIYDDWIQPVREATARRLRRLLSRLASLLETRRDYSAAIR